MDQQPLFHDTFYDALDTVVSALGGYKKVGHALKPELSVEDAASWCRKALKSDRREVFSPEHILWLIREGRRVGCHAAVDFIGGDAGYDFSPIDPETEDQRLQREFIQAQRQMQSLVERMEKIRATQLSAVA